MQKVTLFGGVTTEKCVVVASTLIKARATNSAKLGSDQFDTCDVAAMQNTNKQASGRNRVHIQSQGNQSIVGSDGDVFEASAVDVFRWLQTNFKQT